jgi:hypothetical protein
MDDDTRLDARTRHALEHTALFVCFVSPAWVTDPRCQAMATYARALGKPFRVFVQPGVRLPEQAFLGVTDLEITPWTSRDAAVSQMQQWIEQYRNQHPEHA